ncbi:hypothetical protein Z949_1248 [Sulfitobacter guttiformis KCTC 32187]|nr:hypothetical protein Z949_1248 [Sulfitobacter guttiformis KCTC 32187]
MRHASKLNVSAAWGRGRVNWKICCSEGRTLCDFDLRIVALEDHSANAKRRTMDCAASHF